jgi:ATP-dependent helicase/nuclease subunit B
MAADELCGLLDQAAIDGGVDWSKLANLSLEKDLAAHWRISASFLEIVAEAWPLHLAEQGAVDAMTRRRMAAEALAARWRAAPPQHPVVIAGSTGAGEATRILMRAALELPRGVVLLPGLESGLTDQDWSRIAAAPSHPQHTLKQTLDKLRVDPVDVRAWPGVVETDTAWARRRLISEALAPAASTGQWTQRLKALAEPGPTADFVRVGASGLTLVEADDESEEALTAALLLRETLETPGRTAALVTPEASLARRVAAILARWGVDVGPSAGTPLHRTAAGGFLLLVMRWARDPADPVLLLAVLKHALAGVGRPAAALERLVRRIEGAALRGPRLDQTLEDLARRLETASERNGRSHPPMPDEAMLIRDVADAHAEYAAAFMGETIDGAAACEACSHLAMRLAASPQSPAGDRIWSGRTGAMAAQFLEQLRDLCAEMGDIDARQWPDFAEAAAQRMTAPAETPEHPRIAIWGPLEARLQRRDRMILAGLNEGGWPRPAPADAFLNRALRREAGLADPDERIGLSAHDFTQLANAPEVILLRARRVDDKPAVASRWLWRLRTLAAGGLGGMKAADALLAPGPKADALAWARALRGADAATPASRPAPRPPVAARRLDHFSPSRAAELIRDPYADYAKRILRLVMLRRVGDAVDARERGTAVHAAIEALETMEGAAALERLIVAELKAAGAEPDLIELERPLWLRAADAYQRWNAERAHRVARTVQEERASIVIGADAGPVELSAKADRIDLLTDGTLSVIDFKTGQPKTPSQVLSGLEPQLALEAAIAAHAAFGDIGPAPASELVYFQFTTSAAVLREKNGRPLVFEDADKALVPTDAVAQAALDGLKRMIAAYARADQPYLSRPRVFTTTVYGDYDRLARRGEWTIDEGEA